MHITLRDFFGLIVPGQPCNIAADMAELVRREFSIEARIARAELQHRKRSHLRKYQRDMKTKQLAA